MTPDSRTVLVIAGEPPRPAESLARALAEADLKPHHASEAGGVDALRGWMNMETTPSAVLLAPGMANPLATARQVHQLAPSIQIVFLVPAGEAESFRRQLSLTPMIGNHWTIADPDAADLSSVLETAARATHQRSNLRTTLDRMNLKMQQRTPENGEVYRKLVVSDHHLASVLEYAEDAIVSVDHSDSIAIWNRGAAHVFGHGQEAALGQPVDLLVEEGQANELRTLVRTARTGWPVMNVEVEFRRADGSPFDAEVTFAPVRDDAGRTVSVSLIARDVTERKRQNAEIEALNVELERRVGDLAHANEALKRALEMLERTKRDLVAANEDLEHQATTDALTGLKNRIVFQNSLLEMMAVAARQETPLSLLLIDVDHFKRVNDLLGHLEGDRVLQKVALALRTHTREQDVVARFGGEEFAVLLPNTGPDAAMAVAENLRVGCRNAVPQLEPTLTVSVGAATFATGDSDVTLIGRADEALYASKARGRNRVTHADGLGSNDRSTP